MQKILFISDFCEEGRDGNIFENARDIDYNLVNKLDAYYFTTGVIKGIYIDNNTKVEFNKILRLLNMFNLSLVCYNNNNDYDKLCIYNNYKKIINK